VIRYQTSQAELPQHKILKDRHTYCVTFQSLLFQKYGVTTVDQLIRKLHELSFLLTLQIIGYLNRRFESVKQARLELSAEQQLLNFRRENDDVCRVTCQREHRNRADVLFQASIRVARETDLDPHLL
jgi:hypothetical protein